MKRLTLPIRVATGFSLVEMAIVLAIVALLLGGLLPSISSQIEQQRRSETRKQLDEIQQALIGYAIIYGRLPCPASSTSNGAEDPSSGSGVCTHPYDGFVPAATLGLTSVDSQGFSIDAWNNRIHYAVTAWSSNTFTVPNGISTKGISNLSPDLLVCASSTFAGFSGSSCGGSSNSLTSSPGVPVVIISTGKNNGMGPDETANLDNNKTYVSHDSVQNGFDDLVIWLSPNVLINRMVAAGKLP